VTNERGSQSITVSAKTVAEAIVEAEQRLGIPAGEIDVTVISEGSKGFLGMGGENARILAMPKAILSRRTPETSHATTYQSPQSVAPSDEYDEESEQSPLISRARKQAAARQEAPDSAARPAPARDDEVMPRTASEIGDEGEEERDQAAPSRVDAGAVAEAAVDIVRELVLRMGLDAVATVRSTGSPVVIDVMGDDLGLLIGRHGDTLASLQYLVNAIVGKRVNRWCKVIIDVEHYRMRREETLRALANRQASRVRQSRHEIMLDPMPANERRVVHMTLQSSPWVVTNSVGEEPNRCVVIAPRQGAR
jgi:spoIIIJ-associated protein